MCVCGRLNQPFSTTSPYLSGYDEVAHLDGSSSIRESLSYAYRLEGYNPLSLLLPFGGSLFFFFFG